ncbi:MAG: MBL fold metallo-hydrolase [Phycisphaerales bacterium]|nr:MBL fold metallo-hydrolase [Phycisphaerales bacterium]
MRIPASALIVSLIAFVTVGLAAPAGAGPCDVGDFDADGTIDGTDLATLLAAWNEPGGPADLDEGGDVGSEDLAILLANWGEQAVLAGTFPAMWINGGACGFDPEIQVHQYNEHTYILRQSLCTNFEGPFMYLLFGEDTVLMQDTGAGGGIHIGDTVYGIIAAWLEAHERTSIDLVVTHSHGHGDHVQGDSQFIGQPNTTVVGISQSAVASFFGISNWPTQIVEYDLGGRIIDVIPIPGHQSAHIALYDRATGILFTGDTLYPGRLYISNFAQYVASIGRMVDFTADKPTCHVLGTHIEMTNTPGVDFNFGATFHPDEHPLQLGREHLVELHDAVVAMNGSPQYEVHDDFIIFPLGLAGPAADAGGDDCARPHTEAAYRAMLRAAARLKPAPRLEGGPSGLGAGVARVYFRQRARKVGG